MPEIFWCLAQTIFWVSLSAKVYAQGAPQLKIGDSVSIYSEKAFRRSNGTLFEAVGNVIIISGNETLYGEKASLNSKTGDVILEGSVRFIGDNITLYGSRIEMNTNTNSLLIRNARLVTPEFNIVANLIEKKSEKKYYAKDAEFTTCTDCDASWLLSGKEIFIELDEYVQVYHALAKIKGVDVLYLPYIAIPIKDKRESGLLFPTIFSREVEGLIYGQPYYWAISESSDATFTPTTFGERGWGGDLEYRKVFGDRKWFEISSKIIDDRVYTPGEFNTESDSTRFLRDFTEVESHIQYNNNWTQHLLITNTRDLDFLNDFNLDTEESIFSNDLGGDFFLDKRFDKFSIGIEGSLKKNTLVANPTAFDKSYVQVLPSLTMSVMPQMLYQSDQDFLSKVSYGLDSRFTTFRQLLDTEDRDENQILRNANRLEVYPFMNLNWLNYGAINISSQLSFDYQQYAFFDKDEAGFSKNATVLSTEISFTVDKIFGLAFEETYQASEFRQKDLLKLKIKKDRRKKQEKESSRLVGTLPDFEDSLVPEVVTIKRNSYRHSQEFKFIHHKIIQSSENGNQKFLNQIQNESGWFDNNDIVKEDLNNQLSNETRQEIPKNNTFEFQWNNSLIKKIPKKYNYLADEKYLKDAFEYKKIGFFNISQGINLNASANDSFTDRLTRLYLSTQYTAKTWNLAVEDYYYHQEGEHDLTFSGERKFERLSALSVYRLNGLNISNIENLSVGIQFRPIEVLGFSYLEEFDLNADEKISTIYQIDYMPYNNCWFFNLKFRDGVGRDKGFQLDYVFNFGNGETRNFRDSFFNISRL